MSIKDIVLDVLKDLPDDAAWGEFDARLAERRMEEEPLVPGFNCWNDKEEYDRYVRETVEQSIKELDAGLGIPQEEVEEIVKEWFE